MVEAILGLPPLQGDDDSRSKIQLARDRLITEQKRREVLERQQAGLPLRGRQGQFVADLQQSRSGRPPGDILARLEELATIRKRVATLEQDLARVKTQSLKGSAAELRKRREQAFTGSTQANDEAQQDAKRGLRAARTIRRAREIGEGLQRALEGRGRSFEAVAGRAAGVATALGRFELAKTLNIVGALAAFVLPAMRDLLTREVKIAVANIKTEIQRFNIENVARRFEEDTGIGGERQELASRAWRELKDEERRGDFTGWHHRADVVAY